MNDDVPLLTLVTQKGSTSTPIYLEHIELCIKAGVTCIQLREKSLPYDELLLFGRSLKNLLDAYRIPLIINDHLDLCLELDATGVHLGQTDGNPIHARAVLGTHRIIGWSVNSLSQLHSSNELPLNYIGLGAVFPTANKPDVEQIWGLKGLRKASLMSSHPLIAIGGINEHNACSVLQSGAKGIAAIGVFHHASDPYLTTRNLISILGGTND